MTDEENKMFYANIIKPILLAIVIGISFTGIASLFLPSYESMGSGGYVNLYGIAAIRKILSQENGLQTVTIWFVSYFTAFSLPALIGIILHILWTKR